MPSAISAFHGRDKERVLNSFIKPVWGVVNYQLNPPKRQKKETPLRRQQPTRVTKPTHVNPQLDMSTYGQDDAEECNSSPRDMFTSSEDDDEEHNSSAPDISMRSEHDVEERNSSPRHMLTSTDDDSENNHQPDP